MEKVGLLIDSTTLTRSEIAEYEFVKSVPLIVTIDGVQYMESELTTESMYHHLHHARKMITSQPSPGAFLEMYETFQKEEYTHVLVVTLSEKISGTYQSALIAKSMFEGTMEISVHAPEVASFGVANGVMPLIEMIQSKAQFSKVVDRYYSLFEDAKVMFTLANLMHLFRGGRLSRIQALLGTVLRIKPIIEMIEGKLQLTKKERTNIACFDYFLSVIDAYQEKYQNVYLDIIQLQRSEWAEKIKNVVSERYPTIRIHMTDYVSPVFFVHLGDQGFGIALAGE
ncbi:MAG: DegV family protein [Candidatus Izemoplasmatales bacterium]|jgi:DegV family protein with EDD domain|nr:DegV family protein [Candidatus Izemoplasmatales bacterium]